ncbi:hypothetical protein L4D76_05115 [Photobacterium sagamiensis]|uniref:hypothetical protein n=1 Tax=Photobacterium sagamiensis TaxID=2910241 RepID=UPI003D121F2D
MTILMGSLNGCPFFCFNLFVFDVKAFLLYARIMDSDCFGKLTIANAVISGNWLDSQTDQLISLI